MIKIELTFNDVATAHATLGALMASGYAPAAVEELPPGVTPEVVAELPSITPTPKPKRAKRAAKSIANKKLAAKEKEELTLDDMRGLLESYAKQHGFKAAKTVMEQFETEDGKAIKRMPELQEKDYAAFKAALAVDQAPSE